MAGRDVREHITVVPIGGHAGEPAGQLSKLTAGDGGVGPETVGSPAHASQDSLVIGEGNVGSIPGGGRHIGVHSADTISLHGRVRHAIEGAGQHNDGLSTARSLVGVEQTTSIAIQVSSMGGVGGSDRKRGSDRNGRRRVNSRSLVIRHSLDFHVGSDVAQVNGDLTVLIPSNVVLRAVDGHGFLTRLDLVIAVAAGNGQVLNFPVLHRGESDAGTPAGVHVSVLLGNGSAAVGRSGHGVVQLIHSPSDGFHGQVGSDVLEPDGHSAVGFPLDGAANTVDGDVASGNLSGGGRTVPSDRNLLNGLVVYRIEADLLSISILHAETGFAVELRAGIRLEGHGMVSIAAVDRNPHVAGHVDTKTNNIAVKRHIAVPAIQIEPVRIAVDDNLVGSGLNGHMVNGHVVVLGVEADIMVSASGDQGQVGIIAVNVPAGVNHQITLVGHGSGLDADVAHNMPLRRHSLGRTE